MLLDLLLAQIEGKAVSVTSLAIASRAPHATALRYLQAMVDAGLVRRIADPTDARRNHIVLTDDTADQLAAHLASEGTNGRSHFLGNGDDAGQSSAGMR